MTEFRIGVPPKPSIKVPPTRALSWCEKEGMLSRSRKAKRNDFFNMD
jgi:hypothetical protein